jgi:hypothetical protein
MDILKKSCKAATIADQFKYKWDKETKSLILENNKEEEEVTKAFESAMWFKYKFGLFNKAKKNSYIAPEAIFNLDGTE